MKLKAVLFDLDGTLLPIADQEAFLKCYFSELAGFLATKGYEPRALMGAVQTGVAAIAQNDGSTTNEEAFWRGFATVHGERTERDDRCFGEFYATRFDDVKAACGYNPQSAETVRKIRQMGLRVAVATNPYFPAVATRKRMIWAGLCPEDFELYTTYENSHFCKPRLDYYREVLDTMGIAPQETLMVGNDVDDDMVAEALGMRTFLLTNCLINLKNADIAAYPHGDFEALMRYVTAQVEEA